MTNQYFPYYDETGVSTQSFMFNIRPKEAIALDPRDIISEWTEASLNTLTHTDVYEGMKLYCLADRNIRVCRWIPKGNSTMKFNGNDCIWDVLHGSDESTPGWTDVTTYLHADTVDEQIQASEQTMWKYSFAPTNAYYGFYKATDMDINSMLNVLVVNSDPTNLSYICSRAIGTAIKPAKTVTIDTLSYKDSAAAKVHAANTNFIALSPKTKPVKTITINGAAIEYTTTDLTINDTEFVAYISNSLYDATMIESIVNADKNISIAY